MARPATAGVHDLRGTGLARIAIRGRSADLPIALRRARGDGIVELGTTCETALARVDRAALFRNDSTCKRLRFHDLRGTGLTWMAIRGDDPLKIQQRAGHTSFEMTQKYIRTAEAVGEAIGSVFPPLPACVLGANGLANRPKRSASR